MSSNDHHDNTKYLLADTENTNPVTKTWKRERYDRHGHNHNADRDADGHADGHATTTMSRSRPWRPRLPLTEGQAQRRTSATMTVEMTTAPMPASMGTMINLQ